MPALPNISTNNGSFGCWHIITSNFHKSGHGVSVRIDFALKHLIPDTTATLFLVTTRLAHALDAHFLSITPNTINHDFAFFSSSTVFSRLIGLQTAPFCDLSASSPFPKSCASTPDRHTSLFSPCTAPSPRSEGTQPAHLCPGKRSIRSRRRCRS